MLKLETTEDEELRCCCEANVLNHYCHYSYFESKLDALICFCGQLSTSGEQNHVGGSRQQQQLTLGLTAHKENKMMWQTECGPQASSLIQVSWRMNVYLIKSLHNCALTIEGLFSRNRCSSRKDIFSFYSVLHFLAIFGSVLLAHYILCSSSWRLLMNLHTFRFFSCLCVRFVYV